MSAITKRLKADLAEGRERRASGLQLVLGILAVLWILQIVNALDSYGLNDEGGLHPRNLSHLWEILTSPFLHASFGHLIGNTIPLFFCAWLVSLRGPWQLVRISLFVLLLGGLGTWLIAPAHSDTVGASGVVFGLATYLMARGLFTRRPTELLLGALVGIVLGGTLAISLIPHGAVSWQGHLCGGVAGVIAAWVLAGAARRTRTAAPGLEGGATVRRRLS